MPIPSPFFKIFDDRGNIINKQINTAAANGMHFGNSNTLDANGHKYPKGFTPPVDFYHYPNNISSITNLPVEYGNVVTNNNTINRALNLNGFTPPVDFYFNHNNINSITNLPVEYGESYINTKHGLFISTASDRLKTRKQTYDSFKDFSSKEFTYLLDYFNDGTLKPIPNPTQVGGVALQPNTNNIYLGSFTRSLDDNEDPTMLGYDIEILNNNSPLFNGTVDTYLDTIGEHYSEVKSRKIILYKFKEQLFKFLKNNIPSESPIFLGQNGAKVYYMKNISGLNGLVESGDSDKIKAFTDYGKEFITLEFNEDVGQNIGYLASLYKSLSWSKINGKQIIPENLMRFDVNITITEIRKFNRIIKNVSNSTSLDVYADLFSKYTYTLSECQFFFPEMPHGDSLNMSDIKIVPGYNIKFNYKFSTMKFTKFLNPIPETGKANDFVVDNKKNDLSKTNPSETNNNSNTNAGIQSEQVERYLVKYNTITDAYTNNAPTQSQTQIEQLQTQYLLQNSGVVAMPYNATQSNTTPFKQLKKNLLNAGIREVNRQIITQAALLNQTLENIRNAIPGAGRMSAPTNVYSDYNTPLLNDSINAARTFVGASLKGFFQKP